jgi:hypothetical protein
MMTMIKQATVTIMEINKLIQRTIKIMTKGLMKMIITIKMIKHLTKMTVQLMKKIMMTITHRRLV